jgi:hypothetical protein
MCLPGARNGHPRSSGRTGGQSPPRYHRTSRPYDRRGRFLKGLLVLLSDTPRHEGIDGRRIGRGEQRAGQMAS